jgi:ribulose-5-phosphate 4-epimerase/fuculose-1-phosphate aldolase
VIHTHSTHCVALSLLSPGSELVPALTPYFVMKVGRVPLLAYRRPGDPATPVDVAQAITGHAKAGRTLRAVMLAGLGPNVWHQSPAAAMAVLEELEETARLALLVPTAAPLPEPQIDELRRHFGASW